MPFVLRGLGFDFFFFFFLTKTFNRPIVAAVIGSPRPRPERSAAVENGFHFAGSNRVLPAALTHSISARTVAVRVQAADSRASAISTSSPSVQGPGSMPRIPAHR